jgi:hypothetical protein
LKKIQKEKYGDTKVIESFCEVRFATTHFVMESLVHEKSIDALRELARRHTVDFADYPILKKLLDADNTWWPLLEKCIGLMQPVSDFIHQIEGNKACISQRYPAANGVIDALEGPNNSDEHRMELGEIARSIFNQYDHDSFIFAYLADPINWVKPGGEGLMQRMMGPNWDYYHPDFKGVMKGEEVMKPDGTVDTAATSIAQDKIRRDIVRTVVNINMSLTPDMTHEERSALERAVESEYEIFKGGVRFHMDLKYSVENLQSKTKEVKVGTQRMIKVASIVDRRDIYLNLMALGDQCPIPHIAYAAYHLLGVHVSTGARYIYPTVFLR